MLQTYNVSSYIWANQLEQITDRAIGSITYVIHYTTRKTACRTKINNLRDWTLLRYRWRSICCAVVWGIWEGVETGNIFSLRVKTQCLCCLRISHLAKPCMPSSSTLCDIACSYLKLWKNDHLKSHSLVHTWVKPQRCTQCNDSANQCASLKKHILKHIVSNASIHQH